VKRLNRSVLGVLVSVVAACGGGGGGPTSSGVDPTKPVVGLTADEVMTMCSWSVDAQGGAGYVSDCGDGFTITTQTVAECVTSFEAATCSATVGDIEACVNAMDGDGCRVLTETACEPLLACATPT